MNRVLVFFLGMLFGIIFVFAALAGGIYIAVTVVKPTDIVAESGNYLGDLANMSLLDMAKSLVELYRSKIGLAGDDGKYFTLGEFLTTYNIDGEKAFGMKLPQEVLDIPAFEFFNSDDGINKAMAQIKVSALPAIVNMFGSSSEDGVSGGTFSDDVIAELSNYSVSDLFAEDKGINYVFQNVALSDVLPSSFPQEDSDNKLMWAVGQTKIGKMLDGMSGTDNIFGQLKEGGAFAALGALSVIDIVGDSQYVRAILGDNAVASFVDDNGNLSFDSVINGISLGELLGCQKNEIVPNEQNVNDYWVSDDGSVTVVTVSIDGKTVYAREITDDNGVKLYEADGCGKVQHVHDATCGGNGSCETEEHTHTSECFPLVWYSTAECTANHDHVDEMEKDGRHYPRVQGLYNVLSNLSMADLTGGDTNALFDKIKQLKISDLLTEGEATGVIANLSDMTIGELMSGGFESIYLGTALNYARKQFAAPQGVITEVRVGADTTDVRFYLGTSADGTLLLSDDNESWYEGCVTCKKADCEHRYADCYGYTWYTSELLENKVTGIGAKLASKTIEELTSINALVSSLTISDVLEPVPSVLKSLADTPISELGTAIDEMYLGELLGYKRVLICENTHEHTDECYGWFEADCGNADHEHTDGCYTKQADGLLGKFADKKISQLNTLGDTVKELTLSDVLYPVPTMLADFANTPIGELGTKLNDMYVGSAMGFVRYEKDVNGFTQNTTADGSVKSNGSEYVKADGDKWYEAELTCAENHSHTSKCYEYVWYTDATHTNRPTGINAAFCNYTLSTISDATNDLTLAKLGINTSGNKILESVKDEKITDIGDKISALKMGVALGYVNAPICGDNSHTHVDGCYGWLEECKADNHDNCDHIEIDGKNYVKVKGLSAKIADLTVSAMGEGNAIGNITENLTIGDLIDSGMMNIGGESNYYKFALLSATCDKTAEATATHTFSYGGQTFGCNFQDFMAYSAAYKLTNPNATVTAQSYWEKCHEGVTMTETEKAEHRDQWKNSTLNEFMTRLLSAIN